MVLSGGAGGAGGGDGGAALGAEVVKCAAWTANEASVYDRLQRCHLVNGNKMHTHTHGGIGFVKMY